MTVSVEVVPCRNTNKAVLKLGGRSAVVYGEAPDGARHSGTLRVGDQSLVELEHASQEELAVILDCWLSGGSLAAVVQAVPSLALADSIRPVPGGLEWERGAGEYLEWCWGEIGSAIDDHASLGLAVALSRQSRVLSRLFPLVRSFPEPTLGFSSSSRPGATWMEPWLVASAGRGYELRLAGGEVAERVVSAAEAVSALERAFKAAGEAVLGDLPSDHPSRNLLPKRNAT